MTRSPLPDVPALPSPPWRVRARSFLIATWRGRVLLAALLVWALDRLLQVVVGRGAPAWLQVLSRLVLWVYALVGVWLLLRWLSTRFLWRIRTKLILSYLFVALVPVVLLTLFFAIGIFLFMGLTASRLVTGEIDRVGDVLRTTAQVALADLPRDEGRAAAAVRERLAPARELHPDLAWTFVRGRHVVAAHGDAPRERPTWWTTPGFSALVSIRREPREPSVDVVRAGWRSGEDVLFLQVPTDAFFFGELEKRTGIRVIQLADMEPEEGGAAAPRGTPGPRVIPEPALVITDEGGRTRRARVPAGLVFVAFPERLHWDSGETSLLREAPLPFQFQPLELVRRLSPGLLPRETGTTTFPDLLLLGMGAAGVVFLVMYAGALALGLMLARSITRGVHELSLGTQRLRQGDFSHRIPIRSRDQLGDLAESFNHMSRGIQDLLREQAEKERLEEELRIARQIQMSLLPGDTLQAVPGIRVAALCLPAAEVGGDYYDVLPLGETRMGVLVADVSGKGTSAALYMAELKGLVLSLSRICESPARLLVEANRILAANMDSRTFVTMTYAVVDTAARSMRFARAGHNPLIHMEARTGRTHVLAPPGLGLGLDRGERFEAILEERQVPLAPGDLFLFFTDGLSEAMNARAELFGEGRLREILERSEGLGTEELRERILDEVQRFVGDAAPHDDMTMVVLKVVPEGRAA
jgi:serine phosphatase RsbU (regulator of sigma subunit)